MRLSATNLLFRVCDNNTRLYCCRSIARIHELIHTCIENPVEPLPIEDSELTEMARVQCSTSFLHQADLILRKLIAQHMKTAKGGSNI